MRKTNTITFLSILVFVLVASTAEGKIIYVDDDATGANNGSAWADAYKYLQDALAVASPGDEVWVAQGIYMPDRGGGNRLGNRYATFHLKNSVALKGGYAGFGEPEPNARDVEAYESILSGDIGGGRSPTDVDNSYHVVTGSGTDETAVLDGFNITGGNASAPWSSPDGRGGGMYNNKGSPTVANCIFSGNLAASGAGMWNRESNPKVTNCAFIGNKRSGMGNGLDSSPIVSKCTFSGNSNNSSSGGGMENGLNTSPMVIDCLFINNSANLGGGMSNYESSLTLINCTFTSNWAGNDGGGGIFISGTATLINCIFSGNSTLFRGGAINNGGYPVIMINCVFSGNSVLWKDGWGGAIRNTRTMLSLVNCTFAKNSAANGSALTAESQPEQVPSNLRVTNCILLNGGDEIWVTDNSKITITHSDIQGGQTAVYDPYDGLVWGEGNIDADPCFADPGYWDPNGTPEDPNDDFWVDGDYHLKSQAGRWDPDSQSWVQDDVTSPCIDAGDPTSPIGYEPFPNGGIINIGAYGGTAEASKSYFGGPVCETIIAGDINGDCKVDFADFQIMALHWLE